jgi:HAD superfamily phosphoserine phosphatase-like hydrolase
MALEQNSKTLDVIVYDFCKTLVNIESADDFCIFVLKEEKKYLSLFIAYLLMLSPVKIIANLTGLKIKKILLSFLKGISKERMELVARKYAMYLEENFLIDEVYDLLNHDQKSTKRIFVISAGYSIYIKYFLANLNLEIISNDFSFSHGSFDGNILGNDCYGHEKLKRLQVAVNEIKPFKILASYSDSLTDIPLFNISKDKYFVSEGKITKL